MTWSVGAWEELDGCEHAFGDRLAPRPSGVRTLRQVHGRRVVDYGVLGDAAEPPEGDGIATDRVGSLVGIWTADCVPVLMVAPAARVAAAVHCGWRGSAAGILASALELFSGRWNLRPEEVEAALGPSIGGCCYEVGDEVRGTFVARAGSELGHTGFEARAGRLYLDLRSFLTAEMQAIGLRRIERVGPCTACRPDLLHSYRRLRNTGRQLSYIGWRGSDSDALIP